MSLAPSPAMPILNALFFIALFALPSFAEHSDDKTRPVLKEGPGFYPIDSQNAPDFVKDHADSVYMIAIFAAKPEGAVPARQYDRYDAYLERQSGRFQLWKQLERKHFFGKDSGDLYTAGIGTAFIVKDSNTLVTAAHNFLAHPEYKKALKADSTKEATKILNEADLKIAIFDKDFNLVYSTRVRPGDKKADPIEIVFPGAAAFAKELGDEALENLDDSTAEVMTDVVQIKLPVELKGKPLELAGRAPAVGDTVYGLAFPWNTSSRAKNGGTESDGQSLRLTKGKTIRTPDFYNRILVEKIKLPKESANAYLSYRTICELDSVLGCSGGPIFNEGGKVIGMHNSRFRQETDRTNFDYPRATHGANARLLKAILDR